MELYYVTRVGGVRLAASRNSNTLLLPYQNITYVTISIPGDTPIIENNNAMGLSTDVALETGDVIWITIYILDANILGTSNPN
ncbi:MAG: hypothetical protein V4722_12460 [Bacteroidota bacterium]